MFQKNRLIELTDRAFNAYSLRRQKYIGNDMIPLMGTDFDYVSSTLNIVLPKDFIELGAKFNYCFFSKFEFYTFFYQCRSGVAEETTAARELLGLPHKYMILAIEDDVSALLLETQDAPEKLSSVIWCDIFPDYLNLCKGKPMEQNPTIWPSFTDFFEYLVEQEEKMLEEREEGQ